MKRFCIAIAFITGIFLSARAEETGEWHPAKAPLMTRWAAEVSPTNALLEYPRPQLVRSDWMNLNGLWDYAVTVNSISNVPPFGGKILVPFPIESALSGVRKHFDENTKLWYHRIFSIPKSWNRQRVRLHFGAVDWQCDVWVNGHYIGQHQGGYDPFTFDVTDALHWSTPEEVVVVARDPTDDGDQPRGKQSRSPEGIFYTSTSGIWQTVWLEPVPDVCIDGLKAIPDVDNGGLRLRVAVNNLSENLRIEAAAFNGGQEVGSVTGLVNGELILNVPNAHLWSPDDPFLYDLTVKLKDGSRVVDSVSSYFGMRKIALSRDEQGTMRIALNNKAIFQV
ncbi:MAG TPA: hypothetical protein VNU95_03600, partial [Candidatus Acidoferrales bacterium]|nr:hypothetical protein [Candidatus Acidoferrales bacterium]